MTEFEKSIKRDMTREKFIQIRDKVYGSDDTFNYTYGDVASWLVWNRNEKGEIANINPPAPEYTHRGNYYDGPIDNWEKDKTPGFASKITTDIVFLGLNTSGDGKPFVDSNGNKRTSFQNARHYRNIVNTFFGTEAEGAYYTNIIKPDRRLLLKNGKLAYCNVEFRIIRTHLDIIKDHVDLFVKELDFIGAAKPLLIIFGPEAEWIIKQGLDTNFLKKRFFDCIKIKHYYLTDDDYIKDAKLKLTRYITIEGKNAEKSDGASTVSKTETNSVFKKIKDEFKNLANINTDDYKGGSFIDINKKNHDSGLFCGISYRGSVWRFYWTNTDKVGQFWSYRDKNKWIEEKEKVLKEERCEYDMANTTVKDGTKIEIRFPSPIQDPNHPDFYKELINLYKKTKLLMV